MDILKQINLAGAISSRGWRQLQRSARDSPAQADLRPQTPPQMAAPHFERGNDLFNEGLKKEAVKAFKTALDLAPYYAQAKNFLEIIKGEINR